MKRQFKRCLAVVAAVGLIVAACGGDDEGADNGATAGAEDDAADDTSAPDDTSAAGEDGSGDAGVDAQSDQGLSGLTFPESDVPINIGIIMPLSGPAATLGQSQAQGAELAAEQINEAGGLGGRMIELTVLDDESNPERAIAQTQELIDQGVHAIVGSGLTSTCYAMEPIVREAEIPTYCQSGALVPPESTYMFFGLSPTWAYLDLPFDTAEELGGRMAVLSTDDATGQFSDTLNHEEEAERNGSVELVGYEFYAVDGADVTVQLTKLRETDPDLLFIVASGAGPTTTALRAARDLNWDTPIYLMYSNSTQGFINTAADVMPDDCRIGGTYVYIADQLPEHTGLRPYVDVIGAYTDRYGDRPDMFTAGGSDALNILAAAAALTDGSGPAMRDWMINDMGTYVGASGPIDFTEEDLRGTSADPVISMACSEAGFSPIEGTDYLTRLDQ